MIGKGVLIDNKSFLEREANRPGVKLNEMASRLLETINSHLELYAKYEKMILVSLKRKKKEARAK